MSSTVKFFPAAWCKKISFVALLLLNSLNFKFVSIMFIIIPPLNKKSKPKLANINIYIFCVVNSNLTNATKLYIVTSTATGTTDAYGNLMIAPGYLQILNVCCTSHNAIGIIPLLSNNYWYVRLTNNLGSYSPLANTSVTLRLMYLASTSLV